VPFQFHGVVQHATYDNAIVVDSVDQKMPRAAHDSCFRASALAAQAQMPGSNTVAQLQSLDAAGPAGFISNIAKGSGQ